MLCVGCEAGCVSVSMGRQVSCVLVARHGVD